MNRNKYIVTIKMSKVIKMEHEQKNMKKAKEDIIRILENSNEKTLNKIFNSKPIFTYQIKRK